MIVYLDMDGVLVNFREGVFRVFNKPHDLPKSIAGLSNSPEKWIFWDDWPCITDAEVDSICTSDFWAGLRWTHDGKEILSMLEEKFGKENIFLLTTPMPNPGSGTGKMQWAQRHLPEYSKRLIISSAPKHLFASRDALLIDDKDSNIGGFYGCGGNSILVPRPYNKKHNSPTLPYIKAKLEKY